MKDKIKSENPWLVVLMMFLVSVSVAAQNKQAQMRGAFWNESKEYKESVFAMMMLHDPKLRVGNTIYGPPQTPERWNEVMTNLARLDALCKTKFAGMENDSASSWIVDLNQLPATWCEIAAKRLDYEKKGRALGAAQNVEPELKGIERKIGEIIDDPDQRTAEEYQWLVFEREKWRTMMRNRMAENFTRVGAEMPADLFAAIEKRGDELKVKIERNAPNRSWKQPPYADSAIENLIKQQFLAKNKGFQILKIGTNYNGWKAYDAKTMVGRDSNYEYYKLEKGKTRYKRGVLLVKVPGRPFCQAREWIVKQTRAGAGFGPTKIELLGESGIFMPCE